MSITISGVSDDLVEIEGDIREEFTYPTDEDGKGMLLGFSNGVVLRIRYSDQGIWRISPVYSHITIDIKQAPEDDEDNYSDVAVVDDTIAWVIGGTDLATV